ncbi:MAG: hypothetical protein QF718_00290 [Phycisphaerales bacterium]|jgi:hypothetical protein|nr:hypothetical protein [Phycisphaerales bacterium]
MPRKTINPWFMEEANAIAAIDGARTSRNWEELSTEIKKLSEARSQRAKAAHNGKKVQLIQSTEDLERPHSGGRYLVQPPLVARDAALFDNTMKSNKVSSLVVCREPRTALGLCPIVALGSGVTARVQVEEPKNPDKPTCAWFDHAIEELGDHVLEQIKKDSPIQRRLDYLIAHFSAIPTHGRIYRSAIEFCDTLAQESV